MTTLLETLQAFFTEDGWSYSVVEGKSVLRMGYRGKNGNWNCYAQAREEQNVFLFHSVCPINIPEDKRTAIAEFLTMANYGLYIGNFEMDYSDGEVRYKTSIDAKNAELVSPLINNMVYANVWTLDRYLPGIMKVVYANTPPADAIKEIEG